MRFDDDALPDVPTLLDHDAKLRRLARALIADASKADDVVQRAWVAAVRHRSDANGPRNLLAWLLGAVRRLAREQFRGDTRRERREAKVASTGASPSTLEIVEREAARRAVLNAVLGLAEPYRETLLLRFYEGLPPREMAPRRPPWRSWSAKRPGAPS